MPGPLGILCPKAQFVLCFRSTPTYRQKSYLSCVFGHKFLSGKLPAPGKTLFTHTNNASPSRYDNIVKELKIAINFIQFTVEIHYLDCAIYNIHGFTSLGLYHLVCLLFRTPTYSTKFRFTIGIQNSELQWQMFLDINKGMIIKQSSLD